MRHVDGGSLPLLWCAGNFWKPVVASAWKLLAKPLDRGLRRARRRRGGAAGATADRAALVAAQMKSIGAGSHGGWCRALPRPTNRGWVVAGSTKIGGSADSWWVSRQLVGQCGRGWRSAPGAWGMLKLLMYFWIPKSLLAILLPGFLDGWNLANAKHDKVEGVPD